jgi:hypothetical protein
MSLKSNELLKTIKKSTEDNTPQVRMATIKQVVSGKYRVQFYGEESATEKTYMKMSSATISTAKPVLMQKVNGTYVIMGNIN